MSIHTINLGNQSTEFQNNLPPILEPIKPAEMVLPPTPINSPPKNLLTDDEIDKLIESQKSNIEINIPEKPSPIENYKSLPNQNEETKETEEEVIQFNLNIMNINLDEIGKTTKERIKDLDFKQKKISKRIELIEKFIMLDEKSLAIESAKQEPNMQKIIGIKKSIFSQTELISETTDILLKFEAQIQGWMKTLMDIEKDKVSAYGKIKALNKEQTSTETDINDVMANLNSILKNDPNKLLSTAANTLSISGYDGKKFMG